jgi:tetratricopeptide (TPR) repeat protein
VKLLLAGLADTNAAPVAATAAPASCSSCSTHDSPQYQEVHPETGSDLDVSVQYELLIHQLPPEMYERYARLDEDFAEMFVTASHDQHAQALELLEKCFKGTDRDIFCYEKGRILHRLDRNREAETYLLESIRENVHNPLPHLALALLFMEARRLDEAARKLDDMISADIFTGQALMMRGEVFEMCGDLDGAMNLYGRLLETPLVRAAAEKLHGILIVANRDQEAAQVFKRYLGKCKH